MERSVVVKYRWRAWLLARLLMSPGNGVLTVSYQSTTTCNDPEHKHREYRVTWLQYP